MRKWMRDRLQRRKKKAEEPESQAAPPPLQPAYFDSEESTGTPEAAATDSAESAAEPEVESEPAGEESAPAENATGTKQKTNGGNSQQRGRGRRRRGGRGRGGRGREQAVAQAFTPKGVPGGAPEAVPPESEDTGEPQVAEAEVGAVDVEAPAMAAESAAPPVAVPIAPARPPKGIVVLAIGLPGSGKSSWFKRHNVVPLSSDMMRALLFDDVREQRFVDLVFSNLRSMLKARLIAKRTDALGSLSPILTAER